MAALDAKKAADQHQRKCAMAASGGSRGGRTGRRPVWWIGAIVMLVFLSLIGASYVYGPSRLGFWESQVVLLPLPHPPPAPPRGLSDPELAARVFSKDVLELPNVSNTPKIAFMFLTPGPLPFEHLWERFFMGHQGKYSIYVHSSKLNSMKTTRETPLFANRDVRSRKVEWGSISMVDAERRLLTFALMDQNNQHFVLLSESCIPIRSFDFVYDYLVNRSVSFVDCFDDPGPHGRGRFSKPFLPEIEESDWRKGSQWFTLKRQHALLIVADSVYYSKFKQFCKRGEETRNCYPDEHYLQTYLHMMDPSGIANWSVTHVDWSEGKWHPKNYSKKDVNISLLKSLMAIDETSHVSSDNKKITTKQRCIVDGERKPCFLFARKFSPETIDVLMDIFPKTHSLSMLSEDNHQ